MKTLSEVIVCIDSILRQVNKLIGSQGTDDADDLNKLSLQQSKKALLDIRCFLLHTTKQRVCGCYNIGVKERLEIAAFIVAILKIYRL